MERQEARFVDYGTVKKTEHILVKKNMKKWTKPGVGLTKDGQCEY